MVAKLKKGNVYTRIYVVKRRQIKHCFKQLQTDSDERDEDEGIKSSILVKEKRERAEVPKTMIEESKDLLSLVNATRKALEKRKGDMNCVEITVVNKTLHRRPSIVAAEDGMLKGRDLIGYSGKDSNLLSRTTARKVVWG